MKRFLLTWFGVLVGCLPILGLLLVPQLMRSRAGSVSLLLIGTLALLTLLAAAVVASPAMAARVAPDGAGWTWRTAIRSTGRVWRERRGAAFVAFLAFLGLYAAAQLAGLGLAELLPYIAENPAYVENGPASRWVIHYPAYALQAAVIYLIATLGLAVYADRIRQLR